FDEVDAVKKIAKENPDKFHVVVATDDSIQPITATEGTGLVHSAPSAGTEDFHLGRKYGFPLIPVIADNADYIEGFGEFSGKNAKKHPELIIDFLKTHENGRFLLKTLRYKHRYPACWRCKTELVWKVADEWYIAMDKPSGNDKRTLRERMVTVAKNIQWMPEFGLDRELDWLKNMHDWLISKKNRYWGLALPIYECKKCGTFEVLGGKDELKSRAVSGWEQFEGKTPHKPYIDGVKIACPHCGETVIRINDVGNPWLDAGIVPFSTVSEHNDEAPLYTQNREEWERWFPAQFITESFPGQFKNWFYALIAMSTVLEDRNPFERVLGFGTLVGEDGRPMHKSWGNAIEFNEGADKIGVDVMRWMYVRSNPAENLPFGYKKADEVRRQFFLMLWNTYKFFIEYANIDGFDREKTIEAVNVLDLWVTARLNSMNKRVDQALREYDARKASVEIEQFVSDVSTWYIRRSRDRVWVKARSEQDKQSFYQTLYRVLVDLSGILSPFMPFVSEEMWTNLTGGESVHLSLWPKVNITGNDTQLIADMEVVREIVEVGHRIRKDLKVKVRQPLAKVFFKLPQNKRYQLSGFEKQYEKLVEEELNVKAVSYDYHNDEAIMVTYDTDLTPELEKEGQLRELVRKIQAMRKEHGVKMNEKVVLTIPHEYSGFKEEIKQEIFVSEVVLGETLTISL
ncbi:class I tRNA ligase family protein, partial [Candidatus Roizmanbacteria bacterium]|nr:class I tRNA ligase family protein [Candidatus Roizmanbacteria bacterium]